MCFLSAKRIGWTMVDPYHYRTDLGVKVPLLDTSPKLLTKLLREAVQRSWQRKMAVGLRLRGLEGEMVCPDPVTTMLNSSWAKYHRQEAFAAAKNFCDGSWILERASLAGYEVADLNCALCEQAPDTLGHRICGCPAVEHLRAKFANTFETIKKEWEGDPLFYLKGHLEPPS